MAEEETLTPGPAAGETAPADAAATGEPGAPELELDATAPEPVADEDADDGFFNPADAKLAEANERYVRLAADFDNFRKRAARERAETLAAAGEEVIRDLLPVVDNLERALAAAKSGGEAGAQESVVKGVELTLRQAQAALQRHGVERIVAAGTVFDPHRHEALASEERDDVAPETVTEELEAGYTMRGRLIRAAKVRVARPKAAEAS